LPFLYLTLFLLFFLKKEKKQKKNFWKKLRLRLRFFPALS